MNDSPTSDPADEPADDAADDPAGEGVVHLPRAAKEVVAAARPFTAAIEKVVEDRESLKEVSTLVTGMAATVGDALGDAVRGGPAAPWVGPASAEPEPRPEPEWEPEAEPDDHEDEWSKPLVDPDAPRRPSRVRRIAVE